MEKISSDELTSLFGEEEDQPEEEIGETAEETPEPPPPQPIPADQPVGRVKAHDWAGKRRLSNDQIRTLNDIHDQFAKSYGPVLGMALKREVALTLKGEPRQVSYSDFVAQLSNPSSLNRLILPPLEGTAVVHLDLNFALSTVDRVLGGSGDPLDEDDLRAPTVIEERVIRQTLRPFLDVLKSSWSKICEFNPQFTSSESIPYYLQLCQMADDIVLVVDFDVAIQDDFGPILDAIISICYPYILLQPITADLKISQLFGTGSTSSNTEVRASIEKIKVPVSCTLVRDKLRIKDLLDMEAGDLLTFRTTLDQASEIMIGSMSVFWGRPGTLGRRHAVRIESFMDVSGEPVRLEPSEVAVIETESEEENNG